MDLFNGRGFVGGTRFFAGREERLSCSFKRTFAVPLDARSCSLGVDERVARGGAGADRLILSAWRFAARLAFSGGVTPAVACVATFLTVKVRLDSTKAAGISSTAGTELTPAGADRAVAKRSRFSRASRTQSNTSRH